MENYLIATHGNLAKELINTLKLLSGEALENCQTLCAYTEDRDPETTIRTMIEQLGDEQQLVVFADMFGSSVSNFFMEYQTDPRIFLITGVNVDLLINVILLNQELPLVQRIEEAIQQSRDRMLLIMKGKKDE
ncbi:PTS sugar transporter subunit IIA [Enterococcus raffinosus]|uniref:PTS EIIA type-4 domain-containing protein n=1 Tax=Enterococcus raffinosus ATCC 49464 TaxID=1158602 RepID=R2NVG7_9ENTE|nr:hypothetical protein [Enterococcus raffinosus]EOH74988.1 hypothetical protein UAK_03852 [Enterococcus raffinosus ATCC 49464]EOT82167.1 hypothetical protein I590_00592 [Enterococcus raffinosus ATCC 49464]OJG84629.1 hypothetical protein RV13_GL001751 [Enterococcus raffinosus]UXK04585.1 PTS mannose transporter subunit IIA [Enterococcus raffinosus]